MLTGSYIYNNETQSGTDVSIISLHKIIMLKTKAIRNFKKY